MPRYPLVLIHGYSDDGASFRAWERILAERGYDVAMIHACSYRSLTNEVTIKDIAEGFDRALRLQSGLNTFTTTLIELKLNREPLPLTGKNEVCWF